MVNCNIVERGALNHMGGCMKAGGVCIGCTMPGFPDKFAPFYKTPPGAIVSTGLSRSVGAVVRRLRRLSNREGNREHRWDVLKDVPSGWAHVPPSSLMDRTIHFFYERWQQMGSRRPGRRREKSSVSGESIGQASRATIWTTRSHGERTSMTDAELWSAWRLWMGVAAVVVLLAASLLIAIWLTARSILANAVRALNAVEAIRAKTQPIWALEETNAVAEEILETVQAIETEGGRACRRAAPARR